MNHCREQSSKFPKTDACGIFETIKKSPFLNGNFLLSSPTANASAEIWKFKIQNSRFKIEHKTSCHRGWFIIRWMASLHSIIARRAYHLLYQKMKDERGNMREISNNKTPVTGASCHRGWFIIRWMASLHSEYTVRDSIPRLIRLGGMKWFIPISLQKS